jgi:AraC family transcriptional regulator
LAKIAAVVDRALAERRVRGAGEALAARRLAEGDGWTVDDLVCTSGPHDHPFEEQHAWFSIAIVASGTFQYRSSDGRAVMTPGSLLLGNHGQLFECSHEHGAGDRCVAFRFAPASFERIAADVGVPRTARFRSPRVPPIRPLSPLIAHACAALATAADQPWEEIAIRLAALALRNANGDARSPRAPLAAEARVTRAVRAIERAPAARLSIADLARHAGLSPYHFLRTFEQTTGLTPHQFVRRARLRDAAMRLRADPSKVLDIALDCGFGDVSAFNRAFRAEFGVSPRRYRQTANAAF